MNKSELPPYYHRRPLLARSAAPLRIHRSSEESAGAFVSWPHNPLSQPPPDHPLQKGTLRTLPPRIRARVDLDVPRELGKDDAMLAIARAQTMSQPVSLN